MDSHYDIPIQFMFDYIRMLLLSFVDPLRESKHNKEYY